jgi:hypothetical protein
MANASAIPARPAGTAAELHLHRSELLAYGALLVHEVKGLKLGYLSASVRLNHRTGRRWSPAQWQAWIEPHYSRVVGPSSGANYTPLVSQ